jgi:hypothetical protein
VVLAENGTLIDTAGYLKGMVSNVSIPFIIEYERPFQFTSDVGEVWNLYIHRLNDGLVVLGAREGTAPADIAQRFVASAARFGNNLGHALGTPERAIDEAFDYAVIDASGNLRWAIGGIPLKTPPPQIPDHAMPAPVRDIHEDLYSGFIEPLTSKSGRKVGVISAFEDVTGEQKVLHQSAIFNGFIAALLLGITLVLATLYLRRIRVAEISCSQIPSLEESESSLRWDYKQQRANTDLEREVIKGVVGFLNSESGGTLIIGVDDDKQVLGLEHDYATLGQRKSRDGFQQRLQAALVTAIGERCCAKWVKVRFCSVQGNDVCVITVNSASEPIFIEEKGREGSMYVRVGNTTRPLSPKEAVAYASARWGGPAFRRPQLRHAAQSI